MKVVTSALAGTFRTVGVQALAEVDHLSVTGGNDVSKPAIPVQGPLTVRWVWHGRNPRPRITNSGQ